MFSKKPIYRSPGGAYYKLYMDMAQQPHLLIAGATGSGKSVIINGIIYTLLLRCPDKAGLILIDPKRVELVQYKDCPHCLYYASEPDTIVKALKIALDVINNRYQRMQTAQQRKYTGSDIYVIIDELADLMTTNKREVAPLLQRIAQIGRAARVHIVAATQCPLAIVIPTQIKVNFDARVGLRTRSAQDSKNILGVNGCEQLPRYGQGFYMRPEGTQLYNIPMHTDAQINSIVNHWTSRACIAA